MRPQVIARNSQISLAQLAKLMAHGFLPRILYRPRQHRPVGKHATRKVSDINSQINGPRFLPRILSRTGLVEKIVKAGNHATRNFCDINSQIKGPGEEARSVFFCSSTYFLSGRK